LNRKLIVLLVLAASWLIAAPSASASPKSDAERSLAEAQALLGAPGAAAVPETSAAAAGGREATLVLRDLAVGLRYLDPADRRAALRILARPDQGSDPDNFGPEAAASPICSANFCIHWGTRARSAPSSADTTPANGIPDFAERVLEAANHSFDVENTSLGWNDPISDGAKGGGSGLTDVYLTDLQRGLFGYATTDPGERGRKQAGYLVLDNDYAGFSGVPVDLMAVTMAHEYNHILQFGYDVFQDGWMFESTATFMEDYVFDAVNDYINFMPEFVKNSRTPLAEEEARAFKLYGSAVWNHFLARRWSPEVVRHAWEVSPSVKPNDFAVAAYDKAIRDAGGSGFSQEFAAFTAETAEWRSSMSFPDSFQYADMKRTGKLKGKVKKLRLDHTGYALFAVAPRDGTIKLKVKGEGGVRSSIALVGRKGPATSGTVSQVLEYMPKGGRATVKLSDAQQYDRITAVLANADGRVKGDSRRYRFDDVKFKAAVK
jgi:hypothetical protein